MVTIVVPARLGSTRLKNKMIVPFLGKPLIVQTLLNLKKLQLHINDYKIVCAYDNDLIKKSAEKYLPELANITWIKTSENCPSGTDRIYQAIKNLPDTPNIIINVQGDEPQLPIKPLAEFIKACQKLDQQNDLEMATIAAPIKNNADFNNRNVVKVVKCKRNKALYFSRSPIPAGNFQFALHHIGVYGYSLNAIEKFVSFEVGALENIEKLEQLRALENNLAIYVFVVNEHFPKGIDTVQDLLNAG